MARGRLLRAGRREGREQQRDHEGVVSKATTRARVRRRRRRRRLARARVAARHRARRRNGVTRGTRRERREGSRRCRFCSHARRGGRESKPPFLAETFPRAEARAESYSAPASPPVCREKKTLARLGRAERTSDASPPLATRTRAGAPRRRRSTHHRAFRRETFALLNDERTRPAWLPRLHPRLAG